MIDADRNRHVVRSFVQVVWREGDLARLGEFWTKDCVSHAAPGGAQEGLTALKAHHEGFAVPFAAVSNVWTENLQQMA